MANVAGILVLVFGLIYPSKSDPSAEIETPYGKLVGEVLQVGKKAFSHKFIGVPFAKPPIGDLRFALPASIEPWAETLTATEEKPMCTQLDLKSLKMDKDPNAKMKETFDPEKELEGKTVVGGALHLAREYKDKKDDEDCLYMNIFIPGKEIKSKKKYPILIYYHGGVFISGGATVRTFDGSWLADVGDVIVAVPQFRLGVFGFLHSAQEDIPGNMGLHDQTEAMKFMKKIGPSLGGDPDSITLVGSDSGAWSVGFHVVSPVSQPFFKRAIMMSGSSLSPMMLFSENTARYRFQKFVKSVGCPIPEKVGKATFNIPNEETIKCIKELSKEKIMEGQAEIYKTKKNTGFVPSPDKKFFNGNPWDTVKSRKFGQVNEVILGHNSNEGGMFLATGLCDTYPPINGEPKRATLNDLVEKAKNAKDGNAGQMQMMLPMFFRGVNKKDPDAVRERLLNLIKDGIFVCPDSIFMKYFLKNPKANLYYYVFSQRPKKSYWASWLEGALHMDDQQYLWGLPLRTEYKKHYPKKEKRLAKNIIRMWGNFAKKGSVKYKKKVNWKPNTKKNKYYAVITAKSTKNKKGFPKNLCKDLKRYYNMGRSFLKNHKS